MRDVLFGFLLGCVGAAGIVFGGKIFKDAKTREDATKGDRDNAYAHIKGLTNDSLGKLTNKFLEDFRKRYGR